MLEFYTEKYVFDYHHVDFKTTVKIEEFMTSPAVLPRNAAIKDGVDPAQRLHLRGRVRREDAVVVPRQVAEVRVAVEDGIRAVAGARADFQQLVEP